MLCFVLLEQKRLETVGTMKDKVANLSDDEEDFFWVNNLVKDIGFETNEHEIFGFAVQEIFVFVLVNRTATVSVGKMQTLLRSVEEP